MSEQFERIVQIHPAFDKRPKKPGDRDYGIHGAELRMVLKGPLGATQFLLYTNWMLPHVRDELEARLQRDPSPVAIHCHARPLPADLGYHWNTPIYEGQTKMGKCEFVESGECYYDGSGLNAERVYEVMLNDGHEGVWRELREFYQRLVDREAITTPHAGRGASN